MRAGGCALQQALTGEAAGVVKQAVLLAKRRGHAQVTPLHVAHTMLAAPGGSFRAACLDSHSHPLQCKALELCFNVALNRLPASSNPMLHHHHSQANSPSISNALVAAFKRAQAHQRRGSVEAQQQHTLLAVKIELEQLVISILDDPSVSRVMREAGFSSTQVKSNVEKSVVPDSSSPRNSFHRAEQGKTKNRDDDVSIVVENLLHMGRIKRKGLVLVGECASSLEGTVRALMDKVDRGEVHENLKEVKFITIPPLYSFCNLGRDEVEQKIGELTRLVRSVLGKGVVLYLGDFKWISDYRVSLGEERRYYCSVEHVIMEIGRLVWGIGEVDKFWLMGIADFKTYMRCRNNNNSNNNSLENVWGLHPVTIPANTLGFSLVNESEREEQIVPRNGSMLTNGDVKLSCCADCSGKFEDEARNLEGNTNNGPTLSSLPSWLKDESRRMNNHNQNSEAMKQLCKKWNSFCSSAHKFKHPIQLQKTLTLFSSNCFSFDPQNPVLTRTHSQIPDPIWKLDAQRCSTPNPIHMQENVNSSDSASSSSDDDHDYAQKFKEFNAENLNILCNALEKKVACQKDIIPEIAGTILQCRSGIFIYLFFLFVS
ncbi:chaperone protein clpb1 [Phtheirospermum japonicum]|uniref:Chaperone protein clpb1 n=1 Tax=Phtheirospermum japonicum TaxID=374723 RepID=A0A830CNX0_9LAMI|nr:chaperone protein clpb1 [Phtheirospermum japonicum]